MARTVKKLTQLPKKIPLQVKVLGVASLMDLLLIIFNRLLVFLMQHDFPEIINHILIILRDWTKTIIPGLTILIFLFGIGILYLHIAIKKRYDPFPFVIRSIYFDFWLQTVNLCIPLDQETILLPNVRKIKKGNDNNQKAFEIEILADFKERMLSLNDAINSYLAHHNSEYHVFESYEINGWIRYILTTNFEKEQLRGEDIEL
ncbi:TPA: hypothetical protein J0V08_000256 [Enterococcus faecium]|uniref:hypothetical protein n=1 Tax=Enterococcus TaxID=1350 RepID=UPI0002A304FD|nr:MULTISPECIES: hypothetical protein [Enterococcus]ELB17605.1 hypothetical protein OIQ_05313 [Enterococcus faecium EnGen0025]ELB65375.1 hypothetical protein OM1_04581 [Enterococcus faecium EnGen0054]EOD83524.1 hypothetical protein OGY_02412 [Enterococcus faecium EnGen0006]EOF90908.1 hypothetical protein SKG_02616 [Enterococcus faecium EnGen0166]EOG02657.1 hypothetical protein SKI_00348 [Enterococcus faecium EnGen0167]